MKKMFAAWAFVALSAQAQERDDYRHLLKPWEDLPKVPATGVRGSWESQSRAERWKLYARWKEIADAWGALEASAAFRCGENERSEFRENGEKLRSHVTRFETICLPETHPEGHFCRFESERSEEAANALEAAGAALRNCNQLRPTQSPWKLSARPSVLGEFRSFTRTSQKESGLGGTGELVVGADRESAGWGFRSKAWGSFRREGDFSFPAYGVEIEPALKWGEGRHRLALLGVFREDRGLFDLARTAVNQDRRYGGGLSWELSEDGEASYGLRYAMTLRRTDGALYDGSFHEGSLLVAKRFRLGGRLLMPGEFSARPAFRAIYVDAISRPFPGWRLEVGLEEKAGEFLSTELRPRLRLSVQTSSAAGAGWESDSFGTGRFEGEVFVHSLPDDESFSSTAHETAVGGRWKWNWGRFSIPWHVVFYLKEFGSDADVRESGLRTEIEPTWSLTPRIEGGLKAYFRGSDIPVASFSDEIWVREAGSRVFGGGLFLRGSW